jgi:hypothetical protein
MNKKLQKNFKTMNKQVKNKYFFEKTSKLEWQICNGYLHTICTPISAFSYNK